jgi:uncharacterized protein YyaL (SSP411 family)
MYRISLFNVSLAWTVAMAAVGASAQESTPVTTEEHKFTNSLVNETSPYLLQHAHNPVDWYPWGDEALEKAKAEDKPIFLSIGYSACHWCHVMEHESFEDEEVAAYLNEHFVNIKVDREERPDLDDIYMTAVQMMTGQGGWPMTVFLTPDRTPFFGGTYFPRNDNYGRMGFYSLIHRIQETWVSKRDQINESAEKIAEEIRKLNLVGVGGEGAVTEALLAGACKELEYDFDARFGGWGGAPKFPSSPTIALLLRQYRSTGDVALLDMATTTLKRMAQGGMYDQLGGGFHRYAVDGQWLVPHFEKMLYDNGQLAQVYLEAYQLTKDPLFKRIAQEIFTYQLRDMTDAGGGFYSTEDADSEGEEGKFYIWTYQEIMEHLGEEEGKVFCQYYSVRENGNFSSHEDYHDGQNILHITRDPSELAAELSITPEALEARMDPLRAKLLDVRGKRVRPGLDDKILTAWNGFMISAMAHGYQVLGDDRYREAAERAARFVLTEMRSDDGMLLRTHRNGESKFPGYLDDHANMVIALTDLYEATFDVEWLKEADTLAQTMITKFWDEEGKGFYSTTDVHKNLIARQKSWHDGSEPSGNSMAALGLLRLAKLLDNADYYANAEDTFKVSAGQMAKSPRGYLKMLCAVDFMLHAPKEIAIAGAPGSPEVDAFLVALHGTFTPNKVIALIDPASENADLTKRVPLLSGKGLMGGKPAVFVCENFVCQRPVTEVEDFLTLLAPGK